MIDLALSSLALAVFSKTQQHPAAAKKASSRYYRLLRVAQERIAQVGNSEFDQSEIDACLLAVFLMSRYESVTYRPGDLDSENSAESLQSWFHHDGAMAILKVWTDNLDHSTATSTVRQTRRGLLRSSLLRKRPLPDWMLNGDRFGEWGLELEYDHIVVRIVNLYYAVASLEPKNGLQVAKNEELDIEARELDKALQGWAAHVPSSCTYQRHILTDPGPWPRASFYTPIVYNYSRPGYAALWSEYFAARMLVNVIRLRILGLDRPNPVVDFSHDQQQSNCTAQLKAMADSLASTIPYCLERFDLTDSNSPTSQASIKPTTMQEIKPYLATLAIWPLSIASSLQGIDVHQQQWFTSELARIGRVLGIGVFECAETDGIALL